MSRMPPSPVVIPGRASWDTGDLPAWSPGSRGDRSHREIDTGSEIGSAFAVALSIAAMRNNAIGRIDLDLDRAGNRHEIGNAESLRGFKPVLSMQRSMIPQEVDSTIPGYTAATELHTGSSFTMDLWGAQLQIHPKLFAGIKF